MHYLPYIHSCMSLLIQNSLWRWLHVLCAFSISITEVEGLNVLELITQRSRVNSNIYYFPLAPDGQVIWSKHIINYASFIYPFLFSSLGGSWRSNDLHACLRVSAGVWWSICPDPRQGRRAADTHTHTCRALSCRRRLTLGWNHWHHMMKH